MELDPRQLALMIEDVERTGGVLRPSAFWSALSARNAAMLVDAGVDSFKRTVNFNYFQWVINGPLQPEFRSVFRRWLRHPSVAVFRARIGAGEVDWSRPRSKHQLPVRLRPRGHAIYVAMLWDVARRLAPAAAPDRLEEPELGDPIAVDFRGRRISEDLANSLAEYASIAAHISSTRLDEATLLEVGAGYGRFADLFLTLHPQARVVIVDIPPALALSQAYLLTRHPGATAHRFTPDQSGEELGQRIRDARISFLTPGQFASMPPLGADLVVNISSLHEMVPAQIAEYFRLFTVHAESGFLYTKQWQRWFNPADSVLVEQSSYPYPEAWVRIFEQVPIAQPRFFEAMFSIGSSEPGDGP
jgi:putative sugar O-methyltransferase